MATLPGLWERVLVGLITPITGAGARPESVRVTTDLMRCRLSLALPQGSVARVALRRQDRRRLPRSQQDTGGDERDADSVVDPEALAKEQ